MQNAIDFFEVRVGDVVCKERGTFLKVQSIGHRDGAVVLTGPLHIGHTLISENMKGELSGRSGEMICIVHRPWPAGNTKKDMLAVVAAGAELVVRTLDTSPRQNIHDHLRDPGDAIRSLREAIEVYELGQE